MTKNLLSPGYGGLPAPSPKDSKPLNKPGMGKPLSPSPKPLSPSPLAPAGTPQDSPMMTHLHGQVDQARARFSKIKDAVKKLDAISGALGNLAALGDTVEADDVVKAAGGLVAAGIPAVQLATILADMPQGTDALQEWIGQQGQRVAQQQAQAQRALQLTRHELGVSAIKGLMGTAAEAEEAQQAAPQAALPAPGPNKLLQ